MSRAEGGKFLGYDGSKLRGGVDIMHEARRKLDALAIDEETREQLLVIARLIVQGTLQASEAIHHPATTEEEIELMRGQGINIDFSKSDFETDSRGLEGLEQFFR